MHRTIERHYSSFGIASTLLTARMEERNLTAARSNSNTELVVPMNSEMSILPDFINTLSRKKAKFDPSPYWLQGVRYDPLEVFSACIEFFDRHSESLSVTVIPPEEDVKGYIDQVLKYHGRLTLNDQLKLLLDISHDNFLGAANIGFFSK